jgi:ribosome-binding factor A
MSIRTERVASLLKQEIASLLVRDYNDPAFGFVTVTEVRVTPDLRIAKVFFSVFGTEEVRSRTMAHLEQERPSIRAFVGSRMKIRFVPDLQFALDTTLDRVERLEGIFRKLHDKEGSGSDSGS